MIQQTLLPLVFLATAVVSTSNIQPNSQRVYYPLHNQIYNKQSHTYPPTSSYKLYNVQDNVDLFKPYFGLDKGHKHQQWHNYPRQLDRLEKYYDRHKVDVMDKSYYNHPDEITRDEEISKLFNIIQSHIFSQKPTMINLMMDDPEPIEQNLKLNSHFGVDNLQINVPDNIKTSVAYQDLKRADEVLEIPSRRPRSEPSIQLNKRIFSLFSRIHSMAPRGHALHHRRHLHAYYGIPEDIVKQHFAAAGRTEFRPPGSPLRWG